ncbi:MAG: SDR family NAD(P)-dependent oxidoreductase [Clostridia bacterium]|nr:SDR family NAD(P)-dependent oxidoreductase [Clostridia bacterium]
MAKYLVTGANGGMGRAICKALTAAGDEVWGIDKAADGSARVIAADLTDSGSLEAAFNQVRAEAGALDGIIHAAGIYDLFSLAEISEDAITRDFNVNLFGVYRVNKLFLPLLNENSRVVIISSELAPLEPLPFTGVYAVTKAALEKYAAALRMELQLLGHNVVVVRPGAVKTDMLPASVDKLERFCAETRLYPVNAERFRKVVDRVEARNVPPEKLAKKITRALKARRPRLVYKINRNPLLLMLNALPKRMQLWVIRKAIG